MNKKVSLVLRIVAVLAAAGAIALFFMIRGEMENAFVKTKPLDQVRNVNTTTLRDRVERTNAVAEEVFDLRDTKERNEKTIASQKNTIAQKNDEIDGLKADLDTKTEEANQLTRDKEALSAEVSDLNGKVSDLESQLRSEKERVAQLKLGDGDAPLGGGGVRRGSEGGGKPCGHDEGGFDGREVHEHGKQRKNPDVPQGTRVWVEKMKTEFPHDEARTSSCILSAARRRLTASNGGTSFAERRSSQGTLLEFPLREASRGLKRRLDGKRWGGG